MRDYEELVQELRTFVYVPAALQAADAIEELHRENESYANTINEASEILRNRLKSKWISVEERLPTPREKVVVAYSKGVTIAQMDGYIKDPKTRVHYWRGLKGPKHSLASVTHWMPLPEPPKEDDR